MACSENRLAVMEQELLMSDSLKPCRTRGGGGIKLATFKVSLATLAVVEMPLLALMLVVVAISVLVAPGNTLRGTGLELPLASLCPIYTITDVPCLFCGMTRSFMAMGGLDIRQAFIFHPLGPALYIMMLGFGAVVSWSIASRRRVMVRVDSVVGRWLAVAGVAVLTIAWLVKLAVWRQVGLL